MSSAVGSVAEAPAGAFIKCTLPLSVISTDKTGILRSAAALRANSATTGGQSKKRGLRPGSAKWLGGRWVMRSQRDLLDECRPTPKRPPWPEPVAEGIRR